MHLYRYTLCLKRELELFCRNNFNKGENYVVNFVFSKYVLVSATIIISSETSVIKQKHDWSEDLSIKTALKYVLKRYF